MEAAMTFAELSSSQVALLAGIGLFVFVILRRTARTFKTSPPPSPRFKNDESMPSRAATMLPLGSARVRSAAGSSEHEAWEVEMHELARELRGQIDTKMRALEALIRTADEAIGRLDQAIDRAESLGILEEEGAVAAVATNWTSATAARDASATFASGANSVRRAEPRPRPSRLDDEARFERVYALADAGLTASKIATQIGSQVGEVELILSLRGS
jgi:hypothetical protein